MIETSCTRARSSFPRSSISAAVASRPAYIPKLILISRPGGSCVRMAKAMAGSACTFTTVPHIPSDLTLPWLPPERADRCREPDRAPRRDHGDRRRFVPNLAAVQHHVADELDEVGQRKHVRDRLEERRKRLGREEGTREERHRQVNRVDHRRGALGAAHEAREPDSHGGEGGCAEQ